jgi:hypothetical protein
VLDAAKRVRLEREVPVELTGGDVNDAHVQSGDEPFPVWQWPTAMG